VGGAIVAVGLLALVAILVLSAGGHQRRAAGGALPSNTSGAARAHAGAQIIAGARAAPSLRADHAQKVGGQQSTASQPVTSGSAATQEVADPEASKSFPAPASVHHKAATAPKQAAELAVAPGAPSDAEIRHELAQMQSVQRAERRREQALTAASGNGGSVGGNGTITTGTGVPTAIAEVVAGGNAIADFPYVFGGGHASFVDNAYDCSGSVSYALAAAGLLSAPETSGSLESWGAAGPGKWITVYANAGHTYMYVNIGGTWMRFDTSGRSGVFGSRWQPGVRSNAGFVARHYPGL
jgi:cell wall-associated NlpC family hydrolase